MKNLLFWILALSAPLWLKDCIGKEKNNDNSVAAQIGEEVLTREEINKSIPAGISHNDSIAITSQLIEKWARETLLYNIAKTNISDNSEIEEMVESYRRSLFIYEYQQQVLAEKVKTSITDSDIEAYYQKNTDQFLSANSLIKGTLVKVPTKSGSLAQLRIWYKQNDPEIIENMTRLCMQKGIDLDVFLDNWTSFNDVMDQIPYEIKNETTFLKSKKTLEVSDDNYDYLLYIDGYILAGQPEPLEYVSSRIQNILMNIHKKDFLIQFEDEMYENALKKGEISIYE